MSVKSDYNRLVFAENVYRKINNLSVVNPKTMAGIASMMREREAKFLRSLADPVFPVHATSTCFVNYDQLRVSRSAQLVDCRRYY